MKTQIQSKVSLFASNAEVVRKDFIWQNTLLKRFSALLYAAEDKTVDIEAIRESFDIIKENTSVFSSFRGTSKMSIATMLSLRGDRSAALTNTLDVYEKMKQARFRYSDYLAIASFQIATGAQPADYQQVVDRAKAFYDEMKKQHFFLTGSNDYIFAALLGLSGADVSTGAARIEELYRALKPSFFSGSGVQALSTVLALGGKSADAEARVLQMRDSFRKSRIRLDREYTLPALGFLALLPASADEIANEVLEAYEFLRPQKGFGAWSIAKQDLLLLTAGLVAFGYLENANKDIINSSIAASITGIIIAQQAAASSAAAASSSG